MGPRRPQRRPTSTPRVVSRGPPVALAPVWAYANPMVRSQWPLVLLLALPLACNNQLVSEEDDGGLPDGGPTADAGPDAGTDAGPDAGTHPDAGPDAGRPEDAGPGDAGEDAGPPVDAGCPKCAGWQWEDAGSALPFVLDAGQLPTLAFGLVGDTRPPFYDLTSDYPSQIIGTIFTDLAQASPPIAFVASTGDYMFADPLFAQAVPQAELYVDAGTFFPGPIFPAMGNHECDSAVTSDNCFGDDTSDPNFAAYLTVIMTGFGLPSTNPYFMVTYGSSDPTNPWNAKFIYTAANCWDDGQLSWFTAALAVPTTYTFIVRHEPTSNAGGAPGVAPTDTALATAPFTLKLTGHSHSYSYDEANNEVINGLGGAALDTGYTGTYGYVICRQRPDNAIQCSQYDYDTNQISTEPNSTFAVLADGGSTPAE